MPHRAAGRSSSALLVASALLAGMPPACRAISIRVPPDILVQRTETIVVAKLSEVREWTEGGIDHGEGQLHVSEVLRGDVREGRRIPLVWQNPSDLACPRVEHQGHAGRSLLWFLDRDETGRYRASSSSSRLSLESRQEVDRALRDHPFFVRTREVYDLGDSLLVQIVFVNDTGRTLTLPAFRARSGGFEHHPRFRIEGRWSRSGKLVGPLVLDPDRWTADDQATLTLAPREQHVVDLDLRPLLGIEGPGRVRFSVLLGPEQPAPLSEPHRLRIRGAEERRRHELHARGDYPRHVVDTLVDEHEDVAIGNLLTLNWNSPPAQTALPGLYEVYPRLSPKVQSVVLSIVGRHDPRSARKLDFVLERLGSEEAQIRTAALRVLRCEWAEASGALGAVQKLKEAVTPFLRDENSSRRAMAVAVLAGCDRLSVELRATLRWMSSEDPDHSVRWACRRWLADR